MVASQYAISQSLRTDTKKGEQVGRMAACLVPLPDCHDSRNAIRYTPACPPQQPQLSLIHDIYIAKHVSLCVCDQEAQGALATALPALFQNDDVARLSYIVGLITMPSAHGDYPSQPLMMLPQPRPPPCPRPCLHTHTHTPPCCPVVS